MRGFLLLEISNTPHFDALWRSCHLVVQEEMLSRSCCSNEQSAEHLISQYIATLSICQQTVSERSIYTLQHCVNHQCTIGIEEG